MYTNLGKFIGFFFFSNFGDLFFQIWICKEKNSEIEISHETKRLTSYYYSQEKTPQNVFLIKIKKLLPVKEGRKEGNPNHSGAVPNDDDARARSSVLCAACEILRGTKQGSVRLRSVGSGEREALGLRESESVRTKWRLCGIWRCKGQCSRSWQNGTVAWRICISASYGISWLKNSNSSLLSPSSRYLCFLPSWFLSFTSAVCFRSIVLHFFSFCLLAPVGSSLLGFD